MMARILSVAALVMFIAYLLWPVGSLLRFYMALKAGDETTVENMVHWPSLRLSIEDQINRGSAEVFAQKLQSAGGASVAGFKLSFDSLSLAPEIAAKIATPQSFIFLFSHPGKMHCIWQLPNAQNGALDEDCGHLQQKEKDKHQLESTFRGPNFTRLYEKTHYLFFIDPFTFKFDVEHEGIRLVMFFTRMGFGWKLSDMHADWKMLLE